MRIFSLILPFFVRKDNEISIIYKKNEKTVGVINIF